MHVLLIDDEPMVRKVVRKMLERQGHVVVEAENGRVGLAELRKNPFDLVVTDIVMPEVEGLEVLMMCASTIPLCPWWRCPGQGMPSP